MRETVKRVLTGSPLEQPARRALMTGERLLSPTARRNAREDEDLRRLLRLSLRPDAVCVDVGANRGEILTAMVDAAPDGKHVALEPVPELHRLLAERFPTVQVRGEAAWHETGSATFTHVVDRASRSGLSGTLELRRPMPTTQLTVPTVRLDDVLESPPSVIKIDVEGAELEALQGARDVLRQHGPMVAFEHQYGQVFRPHRTTAVFDELTRHGYRVFDMDGVRLTLPDFLTLVATRRRWNFLAHH